MTLYVPFVYEIKNNLASFKPQIKKPPVKQIESPYFLENQNYGLLRKLFKGFFYGL